MGEENLTKVIKRGRRAYRILAAHRYTTIAGMLTFFLIMSFVPLLFWLSLLLGRSGAWAEELLRLELFGWARDFLRLVIESASGAQASGAGVVFSLTTLWSGSAFFYHLRKSGEILYDFRRVHGGWKVRLFSVLLTFVVLLFFAAAAGILVCLSLLLRRLSRVIFYLGVYSMILVFGIFAAWILNAYILPFRAKPLDTLPGSLITALAWLLASIIFLIYFNISHKEKLYGALSLFIVFLLYLYWMMICFTLGAVYNRHKMSRKSRETV